VILGNLVIIDAYRAGIPGNGKPFPDGAKMAKIEWKSKANAEAPFAVNVPDTLDGIGFIRTARGFRTPADGDTRSSAMTPRPTRTSSTRNTSATPSAGTRAI
jgi:hypothetical protein